MLFKRKMRKRIDNTSRAHKIILIDLCNRIPFAEERLQAKQYAVELVEKGLPIGQMVYKIKFKYQLR